MGHVVEIDETRMKKLSKNGVGRRQEDYWLFDGVDQITHMWLGVIVGANRSKPTLSALIKRHMLAG